MSKADDASENEEALPEGVDQELLETTSHVSNISGKTPANPVPPPPPPPPPTADNETSAKVYERRGSGDSIPLINIPKHLKLGTSVPSSLNSSFVTYDENEDIRDLMLVDDDTTQATPREDSLRIPLPPLNSMQARESSLSPPRPPRKYLQSHSTPVIANYATSPLLDNVSQDEDSFLQDHNAHHERADSAPARPMRGTSITSSDSENIRAAVAKQPYIYLNQSQSNSHKRSHNSSSNNHQSFNSSVPSMWEDSWTTFATLDNSHHTTTVIHEEAEEDHSIGDAPLGPQLPATITAAAAQDPKSSASQQMKNSQQQQQQKQMTMPTRSSSITSSRKKSPKRTNSRNSQYSNFSNMSRSTLDASAMRRTSRNQRISLLKRRSMQTASNASSSPVSTITKSISENDHTISSPSMASNCNSQNSTKPIRRSTKILPHDAEAEAEPDTLWEHSESQLSITSSEDEDDSQSEYDFESDKTPQLPGRRTSASSMSLYEAEAAAIRLTAAYDQPLSAPLRRTSTFGSTTLDPATVVECEDEDSSDEETDPKQQQRKSKRHHLRHEKQANETAPPISSIHLPQEKDGDNLPMSSIQVPTEVDHVPTLPSRQRSIPKRVVKEEWLNQGAVDGSSYGTEEQIASANSPVEDFIPSLPKRQTTFTKEDTMRPMRDESATDESCDIEAKPMQDVSALSAESCEKGKMRDVSALTFAGAEEKENHSNSSFSSSTNPPPIPRPISHRQKSDDAAPNPPARKSSRCLSPVPIPNQSASALGSSSTLDDSNQSLLLAEKDGTHLRTSGADPVEDSTQSLLLTEKDGGATDNDHSQSATLPSCPICKGRPPAALQNSVTSCVSSATTQCAGNKLEPERHPPCRHFTRGSSLRSAAESLKKRGSHQSVDSSVNDAAQAVAAEAAPLSPATGLDQSKEAPDGGNPTSELEQLKLLNEDTVRGLQEQLDCLKLDSSGSSRRTSEPTDPRGSRVTTRLSWSNHTEGSVWTSASKEFEHLKTEMFNLTEASDLETQLRLLEQQEKDDLYNGSSAGDLSSTTETERGSVSMP